MRRTYHHGDLRRALLDAAVEAIDETGPTALSLRDLARRAGVSHAAPAHHFGDKAGLLTALATEGFELLAAALEAARPRGFREVGVAYVMFATEHRAHFEVMFRPDQHTPDDPALTAAQSKAGEQLYGGVTTLVEGDPQLTGLAAWALVHGLATLWNNGALPSSAGNDPEALARAITAIMPR